MGKVDDGEEKEKKKENNVVYSGHLCHCQSTTRMPTDWNANHSCQVWNQFLILCTSYIFPPLSLYSYLPMLSIFHLFKMSCFPKVKTFILFPIFFLLNFFTFSIFTYIFYFLAYLGGWRWTMLKNIKASAYPWLYWFINQCTTVTLG